MTHRQLKVSYFVLAGLNSFATTYYSHYLFFFMQKRFGFGNRENLFLAATNGLLYMFAAWFGGRFAQRFGYFLALRVGFSVMVVALAVGAYVGTVPGQFLIMAVWTIGVCFTWPTLEALVSEKESISGLPRMVGVYNLVWAGMGALAYFTGGAMLEKFGFRSLFWVPAGLHLAQLTGVGYLARQAARLGEPPAYFDEAPAVRPALNPRPIAKAKTFLRLAWLANPFAYVAINTIVAVIPGLAKQFGLSPMWAGFFCSIWLFARLGAFVWLWLWPGWHYRFCWFITAYLVMFASFVTLLMAPQLVMVMAAQISFGMALGLIYYSSLFYSMDVGETKGEHGGLHEAAIGLGIFMGPAAGAAALHFFPGTTHSGILAVSGMLLVGLAGLLWLRRGRS